MYSIEDYYDLEDDLLIDDLLDDDLLEDSYDFEDDLLDDDLLEDDFDVEDDLGEDFDERRRRRRSRRRRRNRRIRPRYPRGARRKSNFGKRISTPKSSNNFISKSEFKKSLDAISKDVNTIKKSALINGKSIKSLDGKYTDVVKDLARKDKNQTKVLKNIQTTTMLGSLLNKPKFDESNLEITGDTTTGENLQITERSDNKTVKFDQTMSLLLPMMTTMGDPNTGKSSSNDMLPLILLMTQNDGNSDDNNLMPLLLLMMMNK